jgi:hypothetical protein
MLLLLASLAGIGIRVANTFIALAYGFAYGATILAHCLDFSE